FITAWAPTLTPSETFKTSTPQMRGFLLPKII
ncbi:MAG: hypothetical protein ACI9QC_000792, partial [Oceanicoccus sp.]